MFDAAMTIARSLGLAAVAASMLPGCATLPDDGNEAKVMRFSNLT